MAFQISRIPGDKPRGWAVYIDGILSRDVGTVKIASKFGEMTYGLKPEGYDGWIFHESGGGGAITIPFVRINREIYIGLILEPRLNMGENPVWCAIGGFKDPNETHRCTAERETREEVGFLTAVKNLIGLPFNSNRGFFQTDIEDEGIHAYGLEIPVEWIMIDDNDGCRLSPSVTIGVKKETNVRFFHWQDAVRLTPDGIALAGIAQLLATIL